MTIQTAASAYDAATTRDDARAAYNALIEHIASDESLDDDADFEAGADTFLRETGRPSISEKLAAFA